MKNDDNWQLQGKLCCFNIQTCKLNESIDNKLLKSRNLMKPKSECKWQNLDSDNSKHGKQTFWINAVHKSKIAVLTVCSLVSMLESLNDKKNFLGDWLITISLMKTPRGPRVLSLVHNGEGRCPHSSIFGRELPPHLFLLFLFSDSSRSV